MLYRSLLFAITVLSLSPTTSIDGAKDYYSTNFRLEDGLMLLHMEVNGKTGWFIFDTGAPGLVLNSNYFTEGKALDAQGDLVGIHGKIETVRVEHWQLKWTDFERSGKEALVCDLSYLENDRNEEILGLVGLDVFQGYFVQICYNSQLFAIAKSLSQLDDTEDFQKLPIRKKANLIMIDMEANSSSIRLIVDTGSESNIIDHLALRHFQLQVKKVGERELVGGDGNIILTDEVEVPELTLLQEKVNNQRFLVSSLGSINYQGEEQVHGILGRPFFGSRCIIIDRSARNIYISKGKQTRSPAKSTDSPVAGILDIS
ncbi:MAG: retropepsin-like domain-containing protein [Saprospiraceae bacterium]|nr:retropepsin-like domain-containing protein [Saprospiraceae bacterium]